MYAFQYDYKTITVHHLSNRQGMKVSQKFHVTLIPQMLHDSSSLFSIYRDLKETFEARIVCSVTKQQTAKVTYEDKAKNAPRW